MYKYIKRLLDIFASSVAIIVLSPVLIITAVLVRIKLGSPVLFKQQRPGKDEKIFTIYKFRTMTDECDENGELLPDSVRLTKFGRFLRASSIDELPELFNILKGDMSVIGPRPLAIEYLPFYNEEEKRRHSVSPGLTGLAQVMGRNSVSWNEKFKYDIEYVDNYSLILDIKILLKTILVVFKREDIGQGEETPEDFNVVRQREWDESTYVKR